MIDKKLNLNFDDFFDSYDQGIKYHDKHLFSTGAMSPDHTELIVKYFESQGLTTLKMIEDKEYFEDLCVVERFLSHPPPRQRHDRPLRVKPPSKCRSKRSYSVKKEQSGK